MTDNSQTQHAAALYARYSSDRQDDRSIGDQLVMLRARAMTDGFAIAGEWSDAAISGAATANRPGLLAMLDAARAGAFTRIYVEDLDRLSRGQGDTARIFERLTFQDVAIHTLSDGEITEMHAGLKGTMNALFLKQLAAKTRRGQAGRVRDGKIAGGLCYGYRAVPGEPGVRQIDDAEAKIVRRIFRAYAGGKGPRAIVRALNAERIPGPRGRLWTDNVISGSAARHTGILMNPLYRGEIVWGRQKFVKDPDTGKRQARPQPESEWLRAEVPQLRIVHDDLWQRVQERRLTGRMHQGRKRAPKRLLSGLMACSECGASYIQLGRGRVGCQAHKATGTCRNGSTVAYDHVEARVLEGVRKHLLRPDLVREAVATYRAHLAETDRSRRRAAMSSAKRIGEIAREEKRLVEAIAQGTPPDVLLTRLRELETERKAIEEAEAAADPPTPALHPQAAGQYADMVATLRTELAGGLPAAGDVVTIFRSMVREVVITPLGRNIGVSIDIRGDLAALMSREAEPRVRSGLVAGARNTPEPDSLPFRIAA